MLRVVVQASTGGAAIGDPSDEPAGGGEHELVASLTVRGGHEGSEAYGHQRDVGVGRSWPTPAAR